MRWSAMIGCGAALLAAACGERAPEPLSRARELPSARVTSGRCGPGSAKPWRVHSRQGGTLSLVERAGRELALVADADEDAIHTVDVASGQQLAVTPLSGSPSQLLPLPDGRVAVTLRDRNRVELWAAAANPTEPLEQLCGAPTPAEPVALASDGHATALAVSSSLGARLTVFDTRALAVSESHVLPRDPRAVLLNDAGDRAWVSHGSGSRLSIVDIGADAPTREVPLAVQDGELFVRRELVQGHALTAVALTPGAAPRLFVPGSAVHPGEAEISAGYGGSFSVPSHVALVSVIDSDAELPLNTRVDPLASEPLVFDDVQGHRDRCLLPRAAAARHARPRLLVACLGSDQVQELDARAAEPSRALLHSWRVPDGPTGLAETLDGRVLVWSQFARQLALLEPDSDTPAMVISTWQRTDRTPKLSALARRGRSLFHQTFDLRISRDGRACASCHPDGRDDGLTWSTPDGPHQTIALAGRLEPPFSWRGDHETLDEHLDDTLVALRGRGLLGKQNAADRAALLAWLEEMPAPTRAGEWRPESEVQLAAAGHQLYREAACDSCHVAGGADGDQHSIRELMPSPGARGAEERVDTPSLRLVAATGPFFHAGQYSSLEQLLEQTNGHMGNRLDVDADGRRALAAYLESL